MSIYERNPEAAPDSDFEPGCVRHLVVGNVGRVLDPRRTPVTIVSVREPVGSFVVRIDDFEDRGATWDVPFEHVGDYQFARTSGRLPDDDADRLRAVIERLDHALAIECDPAATEATRARLEKSRRHADEWIDRESTFVAASGRLPAPATRVGDARMQDDLERYLTGQGVWDLERVFARQFVRNPSSGELVKGHRIVIAELGLVPFAGSIVRDPALFDGAWSRARRADHVIARLGLVRALLTRIGLARLPLFRGVSVDGSLDIGRNRTFVSATFDEAVARSHFESAGPGATRALYHQSIPVERVFMTYLETAPMNEQFREAEAVLLRDGSNAAF